LLYFFAPHPLAGLSFTSIANLRFRGIEIAASWKRHTITDAAPNDGVFPARDGNAFLISSDKTLTIKPCGASGISTAAFNIGRDACQQLFGKTKRNIQQALSINGPELRASAATLNPAPRTLSELLQQAQKPLVFSFKAEFSRIGCLRWNSAFNKKPLLPTDTFHWVVVKIPHDGEKLNTGKKKSLSA
jgi:hypothetical protein